MSVYSTIFRLTVDLHAVLSDFLSTEILGLCIYPLFTDADIITRISMFALLHGARL